MSKPQRRWSPQEDSILQKEVKAHIAANEGVVRDWSSIAQKFKARSNKDCRKRFYNGLTENLKKGPWTSGEDQALETLMSKHGPSWATIAQEIKTRSADQCSKRWQHCLDPELDRSSWSAEENTALMLAVRTHESAWKEIQTMHFPNRSANNIKNQYSVLKRRNLEAPQDSRSCCFARAEDDRNDSPSKTNMPHMSIDNSDLSDPFGIDMDLAFDGLSSADHQYPDFDQSFPYAISEPGDPFQLLEPEAQSPAMPPDIFDQSPGPSVTRGLSAMDIVAQRQTTTVDQNHDDYFDFDKQDEMPNSISYRQTQPGQQNRPCHNNGISDNLQSRNVRDLSSASACAFGWPNIFDPNPAQQHRLQSPSSAVGPNASSSSSPTSSGMQTTIRLEGADQSTLSAVIGTLIETKAKFRLETH